MKFKETFKVTTFTSLTSLIFMAGFLPISSTVMAQTVQQAITEQYSIEKDIENFKSTSKKKENLNKAERNFKVNLVTKDGTKKIDKDFQYPIRILNGRTAIAVKDFTDSTGLELGWNKAERIATANTEDKVARFPIDKRVNAVNNKVSNIDIAATIDSTNNRTYIPLRSMMESLGYDVTFEDKTSTINIYEPGVEKSAEKPIEKPEEKPVVHEGKEYATVAGIKSIVIPEVIPSSFKHLGKIGTYYKGKHTQMTPLVQSNHYDIYDAGDYFIDTGVKKVGKSSLSFGVNGGRTVSPSLTGIHTKGALSNVDIVGVEYSDGTVTFIQGGELTVIKENGDKDIEGKTVVYQFYNHGGDTFIRYKLKTPYKLEKFDNIW